MDTRRLQSPSDFSRVTRRHGMGKLLQPTRPDLALWWLQTEWLRPRTRPALAGTVYADQECLAKGVISFTYRARQTVPCISSTTHTSPGHGSRAFPVG